MANQNAGEITYKVSVDTSGLKKGLDDASKEASKFTKKQKSAMKEVGDAIGDAFKKGAIVAGGALVGLTTLATKNYAEYEQMFGGIESMFGGMQEQIDIVQNTAKNAWKDLTMSQTDYYKNFSATYPLIKNDVADVNEAISLSNKLLTIESDLANTFGYSMETASTAINWALKGSFNYLDNLNIGIKGTQDGFLEASKACGYMVDDVKELTSDQIIDVIEQYAGKYGVIGKTAEEADKTVQGSLKSMQGAWDNFTVALADPDQDLNQAIDDLVQSVDIFIQNVAPVVEETLGNIFGILWEKYPVLTIIAGIVGGLAGLVWAVNFAFDAWVAVQTVATAVQGLFNATLLGCPVVWLVAGIGAIIGIIVLLMTHTEEVGEIFKNVMNGLIDGAGKAWEGIKSVFSGFADFFKTIFTNAWTAVKNVFSVGGKIFNGIKDGIVKAFKTIVNGIIDGINKVVSIPFNAINGVLDGIRSINILGVTPFTWIGTIAVPQIPHLATGGIVPSTNGGQLILAGEAGEDEWVVPESKMASLMEKLNGEGMRQNITINIQGTFATSETEQRRVAQQIYDKLQEINKSKMGAML